MELKASKSYSSPKIDEIQGIIFGGGHSRFWMLRKHMNELSNIEYENVPFYCWECITL